MAMTFGQQIVRRLKRLNDSMRRGEPITVTMDYSKLSALRTDRDRWQERYKRLRDAMPKDDTDHPYYAHAAETMRDIEAEIVAPSGSGTVSASVRENSGHLALFSLCGRALI